MVWTLQRLESDMRAMRHVFSNEASRSLRWRLSARALRHVPEPAQGTILLTCHIWQSRRSPLSGAAPETPKDETSASV